MLLVALALAAPPGTPDRPAQLAHADYLAETGRGDAARAELAAILAADPTDLGAMWRLLPLEAHQDAPAMVASVRRWLAANPGDPVRRAALAMALDVAADQAGAGLELDPAACAEAIAYLDPLPEASRERGLALGLRFRLKRNCELDTAADEAALLAMADTEPRVRPAATRLRFADGVELADVEVFSALMADEPWRLPELGIGSSKLAGPALDALRAAALAEAMRPSTDPVVLRARYRYLLADGKLDEARKVAATLGAVDPPSRSWNWVPKTPPPKGAGGEGAGNPVEVVALGSPDLATRLTEMGTHPPAEAWVWERGAWWSKRARLLDELGRQDEALAAFDNAWGLSPGYQPNAEFGKYAVRLGKRLGNADLALTIAVDFYRDEAKAEEGRAAYAEVLGLRAWVRQRQKRWLKADIDAREAIAVADSPIGHVIAGLVAGHWKNDAEAATELAIGLARPKQLPAELAASGQTALDALWTRSGWWVSDGVPGWVALHAPAPAAAQAPESASKVRLPFPDAMLTVDGVQRRLSSFPGPLVVDVWASWCGPCRRGLPELDDAARVHASVPFLAISIDEEQADATAALAGQTPTFVAAWAGQEALGPYGGTGIPFTYILDAEHKIVAREQGYGPGRIEQFVREVEALR